MTKQHRKRRPRPAQWPFDRRRQSGFTLIELLTVVGIISVLIALLLPAVQQAREAARRVQCRNNLGQLALALHNYDMTHGCLPIGSVNPTGPIRSVPEGYHVAWTVQLLPFIDESALFHKFDFSHGVYSPQNAEVRNTWIHPLICPSDPARGKGTVPRHYANYAAVHNDTESPIDVTNNGCFVLNRPVTYREIEDGVSQTLVLGEKLGEQDDLGWFSGTRATLRNAGSPLNQNSDLLAKWPRPPRQPGDPLYVGGFSSAHAGGAHFALADGSVRFIGENIEPELFGHLANRHDGESATEF